MTTADDRLLDVPQAPGEVEDDYGNLFLSGYALIDVRAPVEFTRGAFPGSVNLPLMSDAERHEVGICYKAQGQDAAIALGAKLVTPELQHQRIEQWRAFIDTAPDARLYCFRGGLRSRIAQQWLADAGIDIPIVSGGYKALRSYLMTQLERLCQTLSFKVIGGRTGNGKTLLLKRLGPTVDLERLANHRGSSFGAMPDGQPGNIDYENALTVELMRLEQQAVSCVYLEDEAKLIGRVCNPDGLRQVMQSAPLYILECDLQTRVNNCFDDYVTELLRHYQIKSGEQDGFARYAEHHRESLARIRKRFGGENYKQACKLLDAALDKHNQHDDTSGYQPFIEMLLCAYYDPMYDYQLSQKKDRIVFRGTAEEILEHAGSVLTACTS